MTEEIDLLLKLLVDKNSFSQGQKAVGELEKSIEQGMGQLAEQFSQTAQKAMTGIADPQQRRDALQQLASLKQMTAANLAGAKSTGEVKQQVQAMSAALEKARADADQYASSLNKVDQGNRNTARSSERLMMTGFALSMVGQQIGGLGKTALSPISQYTKYAGMSDEGSAHFLTAQRDMENAMIRIGAVMAEQVTPYLEKFADALESLASTVEKNPGLATALVGTGVGLTVIGNALMVLGTSMVAISGLSKLAGLAGLTGGAATAGGGAATAAAGTGVAATLGTAGAIGAIGVGAAATGWGIEANVPEKYKALTQGLLTILNPLAGVTAGIEQLAEKLGLVGDAAKEASKGFILSEEAVKAFAQGQKDLQRIDTNYAKDRAKIEEDYEQRRSEIVAQYGEQRTKLEADYERERAQVVEDYQRQQSQAVEDYQRQQAQAVEDFQRQQAQAAEDFARQLASLDADYQKRRADLTSNYQQQEAEATAKYNEARQKAEEDYQQKLRDAERQHSQNVEDLVASRDALGLARENRRFKEQKSALAEEYAQNLAELAKSFKQERAQRAEEYKRQLQEAQQNYEQQRAERIADFQRQQAEKQEEFTLQQQRRAEEFGIEQKRREDEFNQRLQQMDEQHRRELVEMQQANQRQLADLQRANQQRLAELRRTYEQERSERVAALRQQIGEMTGIWQEGLDQWKAAAQAFFAEMQANPTGTGTGTTAPSKAEGGYVYPGLWNLHAGEYVMTASTVSAAERMMGGNLTQGGLLSAMGAGNALSQQIAINAPLSAADRSWIKQTMRSVFQQGVVELYR